MHRCFRKWSKVLLKCHCCVFTLTLLIFLLVSKYIQINANLWRHECRELQIFWGPVVCMDTQSKCEFYFCRNSETVVLEHQALILYYREMHLFKIEKLLKSFTQKKSLNWHLSLMKSSWSSDLKSQVEMRLLRLRTKLGMDSPGFLTLVWNTNRL